MSTGAILLVCSLLSLSGLGILHKVADFRRCKPSSINMVLFCSAALVLWGYTYFYKVLGMGESLFPPFTFRAVILASVFGLCASIAILTFQIGIRYGRISTSWLVINLSASVPAILSLVIYREWESGIKWQPVLGLLFVFASIFLLWRDKALEIARGEEPIPQQGLPEPTPIGANEFTRKNASPPVTNRKEV